MLGSKAMFTNSATSIVAMTIKTKYERQCFLKETPCVTSYVFHCRPSSLPSLSEKSARVMCLGIVCLKGLV